MTYDTLYTAVRARSEKQRQDWLTAAFHVAESFSVSQCRALLNQIYGQPLLRTDSDIAQVLAARAGAPVVWRHVKLDGNCWREGKGE